MLQLWASHNSHINMYRVLVVKNVKDGVPRFFSTLKHVHQVLLLYMEKEFFQKSVQYSLKWWFYVDTPTSSLSMREFNHSTTHLIQSLRLLHQDHPLVLVPPPPSKRTAHDSAHLFTKWQIRVWSNKNSCFLWMLEVNTFHYFWDVR